MHKARIGQQESSFKPARPREGSRGVAPSSAVRSGSLPKTLMSSEATYRKLLCRVASNQRGSVSVSVGSSTAADLPAGTNSGLAELIHGAQYGWVHLLEVMVGANNTQMEIKSSGAFTHSLCVMSLVVYCWIQGTGMSSKLS